MSNLETGSSSLEVRNGEIISSKSIGKSLNLPNKESLVELIVRELKRQKTSNNLYYQEARGRHEKLDYCAVDGNIDLFALADSILTKLKENNT